MKDLGDDHRRRLSIISTGAEWRRRRDVHGRGRPGDGEWEGGISQLGGLEERCKLPSGVRGGAPAANAFW